MKMRIPLLVIVVFFLSSTTIFAAYFGSPPMKMIGGISSGYFGNHASNVQFQGKSYNLQSAVLGAYSIWKSDTIFNMTLLPAGSTNTSKIAVYVTESPDNFQLGFTNYYKNGSPISDNAGPYDDWDRAIVFLNLNRISEYNNIGMNFTEYRALAIHEIGHALGLAHQDLFDSVMKDLALFLVEGFYVPQPYDIQMVNDLYTIW